MSQLEFEGNIDGDGEEYKVEAIRDSAVYARESEGHLPGLYYLVSWKGYPEEENTWKPASAIQQLQRLVSTFYKEHPKKSTTTTTPVNSAQPMVKPAVKPVSANKQKRGRPAKATGTNQRAKKSWAFDFYLVFDPISSKEKEFLFARDDGRPSSGPVPLSGFLPEESTRPGGFFYQRILLYSISSSLAHPSGLGDGARPFDFPPPNPARVLEVFRPLVFRFSSHFPLGFWRFFNYA